LHGDELHTSTKHEIQSLLLATPIFQQRFYKHNILRNEMMQGRRHNHIQPLRPDNWLYLENKSMESPHTDHDIEIF
jgi:hypothetical protein